MAVQTKLTDNTLSFLHLSNLACLHVLWRLDAFVNDFLKGWKRARRQFAEDTLLLHGHFEGGWSANCAGDTRCRNFVQDLLA